MRAVAALGPGIESQPAMSQLLHIWGRISSINVRKVVLAAQWMGLDFKRTDAGLSYGVNKTPEYLRINPNAQVPVMQDGDMTLWESNVIVRYLCAKHSMGDLYPHDLKQRFDAERWMDWQQTTMNNAGRAAFVEWIRTPGPQPDMAAHYQVGGRHRAAIGDAGCTLSAAPLHGGRRDDDGGLSDCV